MTATKPTINPIRWQQRFANFDKAFAQLSAAVNRPSYDRLAEAGLIQFFEFTFELAWKTLKDFLELKGFTDKTPRDVIKRAFQIGLLKEGATLLDALDKRNLLAHAYDENNAHLAVQLIKQNYFPAITELLLVLQKEL